jgi:hypothetical protein
MGWNQKSLRLSPQALFVNLVYSSNVACLWSLGSLLDIELDPLAFLQVAESITLNSGEMDKDVLSTFTLDEAETLITIEPLDSTSYSLRHFLPPLGRLYLGNPYVPSEVKTKQPTESNRELWLFF